MENSELIDDYDHLPQLQKDDQTLATIAHLGPLVGWIVPMGSIVVPLAIWLIKKEDSEFIDIHAKEALNFQISMLLAFIVAGLLCIVLIGIPIVIGLAVFNLIVCILAAVKANRGEYYEYPWNLRFIK